MALAPDGHGGMLDALSKSGALRHARDRNIALFSYGQIDNPLVQICHPELIGYHLLAESEMTSQVIRKIDPLERVGNVVMVDGKMQIIEYSDLPHDMAQQRNPDGSLFIWAGSIAVHVFNAAFLERISQRADALPFHLAKKQVPFLDAHGVEHTPDQPNAIKFERFIFDLLPWARNAHCGGRKYCRRVRSREERGRRRIGHPHSHSECPDAFAHPMAAAGRCPRQTWNPGGNQSVVGTG